MQDYFVDKWNGLLSRPKDDGVPKSYASNLLNWLIFDDRIELRRGMELMGTEIAGAGRVSGLKVGHQIDGTELLVRTRDQKVEYYDVTTADWIESLERDDNDDQLGVRITSADDISIEEYQSLAGSYLYFSNPNCSVLKMPVSTPSCLVSLSDIEHRGYIKIQRGSTFLWNRNDLTVKVGDSTGLYRSKIDKDELSDFTETTNEIVGTGDGTTKTFTDDLALDPKETCHYVRITDGTEIFTDDRNGLLVGNLGGTGTINYASGTFEITFNTAPANLQSITADYYTELSDSGGIFDFSQSATRQAGEGVTFRQDDGGGAIKNVGVLGGDYYTFHEKNIYKTVISDDDSTASNLPYRNNAGIENWRAMVETDEGIYFIDSSNKADPYIRILQPGYNNPNALPKSVSDNIDLSGYDFSEGGMKKWGEYIIAWGKVLGDAVNNRMFLYHRLYKNWTITDYRGTCLDSYNGALVAGDSGSYNVLKLFSGITDDEADIKNFYETGDDDLDKKRSKIKQERFHRFVISGLIQRTQSFDIYFSYDNGKYIKVGTVDGTGDYVDQSQKISVGNTTVGTREIGGSTLLASPYQASIKVHTPKFNSLKQKFVATNIGYVSIHNYECKDRRAKGRRAMAKYIQ